MVDNASALPMQEILTTSTVLPLIVRQMEKEGLWPMKSMQLKVKYSQNIKYDNYTFNLLGLN